MLTFQFNFLKRRNLIRYEVAAEGKTRSSNFQHNLSSSLESLTRETQMLMTWIVQGKVNSCYQIAPVD
jgi:hypothetical protein